MEVIEVDAEELMLVKRSHGRCLMNENFLSIFYDKFSNTSEKIAEKFVGVDMDAQIKLLQHGLNCIIMYTAKNRAGVLCLDRIANTHGKTKLNILPEYYALWKTSFLETVAEVDGNMDYNTLRAWNKVIDFAIIHISSGYES